MPASVRDWLVWNPMLICIEWFRSGIFAQYQPPWVSPGYVLAWACGLVVLGLFLERPFRRLARA
jgi:capsular polysaccharide transport system permease protein